MVRARRRAHAVRWTGTPGYGWVQIAGMKDRAPLKVRVVATRTSPQAAAKARKDAWNRGSRIAEETLEAADYLLVVITLSETAASAADMLELYRFRRQMECACNVCSTSAPSIAT